MREDRRLGRLLEDIFSVTKMEAANPSQKRLTIYDLEARRFQDLERVKEAVLLPEQVVKIKQSTMAKTHPSRIVSEQNLACLPEAIRQHQHKS